MKTGKKNQVKQSCVFWEETQESSAGFTFFVATHDVQLFELLGKTWIKSDSQCQISERSDGHEWDLCKMHFSRLPHERSGNTLRTVVSPASGFQSPAWSLRWPHALSATCLPSVGPCLQSHPQVHRFQSGRYTGCWRQPEDHQNLETLESAGKKNRQIRAMT